MKIICKFAKIENEYNSITIRIKPPVTPNANTMAVRDYLPPQ